MSKLQYIILQKAVYTNLRTLFCSGDDKALGIAINDTGNAYVTVRTYSDETDGFPLIGGPDLTFNGDIDAFVAKVTVFNPP